MTTLQNVRVLDITQVLAGAYCSMLLADMGADVIKIERPDGGDDTRGVGRARGPKGGDSPAFQAVNRNKRGIAVDLSTPAGVALIKRLVVDADVLVENFRPGTLDRFGLGYAQMHELNPALVYCSISGFGATGPYASRGGFDLIAQGMSGLMSLTGEADGPPVKAGVPICDVNAGLLGAMGILSAYIHRLRTGEGQHVDTSLFEAGIATTMWDTALFTSTGQIATRTGSVHRFMAPYEAFRTSDGWMNIGAANPRLWERLCAVLGREALATDSRFAEPADRLANRDELRHELEAVLETQTAAHWSELLEEVGVPCGPVYDISQVYDDPQAKARDMLVPVEHPQLGKSWQIGVPVKLSETPWRIERAAPMLGEHTREVLQELGLEETEITSLLDSSAIAQSSETVRSA